MAGLTKKTSAFDDENLSGRSQKLFFEVTEEEVKKAFDGLDNKSSAGDDGVSNLIAKAASEIVVPVLTLIIQKSFKRGVFPDVLKHAKVIPLHKDGSKSVENNNRPIS